MDLFGPVDFTMKGERGRTADRPREIPARGWKDIFFRVKAEVKDDKVPFVAAGVAFYLFLGMIPMLGAFVSLYGLVAQAGEVSSHLATLERVLPRDVIALIGQEMRRIAGNQDAAGFGLLFSLALAIWGGSKATDAIMIGSNVAYDEREKRNFLMKKLLSLGLTLGSIGVFCLVVGLLAVIPAVVALLNLPSTVATTLGLIRWPLLFALAMVWLSVLYRYAPSREEPKWRWVSWGAFIATFLWVAGSVGFSFYVANFGKYNSTYGSLGAIVVLLMWFYISAFVALLGAEINSEMEHQTARDSTTGPREPLGERGAHMADDIGKPAGA